MFVTALLGCTLAALPPDYDAFYDASETKPVGAFLSAADLFEARRGQISSTELRVGVPTFFWAPAKTTTDEVEPSLAARAYLMRYASLYRTDAAGIDRLHELRVHDAGRGAIIVAFGAKVGGLPVFRDEVRVVMKRDRSLVAITGYVVPRTLAWDATHQDFELTAEAALSAASVDLLGALFSPAEYAETRTRGTWRWFDGPRVEGPFGAIFPEPSRVRRVVFAMPDSLRAAYHVELVAQRDEGVTSEMFGYVIDAATGRILFRRNLTDHDAYGYRVYAEPNLPFRPLEGPQGDAWLPHPTGTFAPFVTPTGTSTIITLESGQISTNDPWLPDGATETNGNNVDAYLDADSPDGLNGADFRAVVTSSNTFDYFHDIDAQPASSLVQQNAAIVQLFYTTNFLHDWFYDRGFDEAAGNAQFDNYGRGGEDEDSMRVEAQDYRGFDNANMSTRADGARPRMQMYIWRSRSHASIDIAAPSAIAGSYPAGTTRFGPNDVEASGTLALVMDDDGDPLDGCTTYTNTSSVVGRIALVVRGNCSFLTKANNAEAAGALGVVLTNDRFAWVPNDMTSSQGTTSLPMVSVTEDFGNDIRARLAGGEPMQVTIRAVGRPDRDSALDGVIVTHEWGHYLSNRLVGNASGLSQIQSRGMGEGWSDFLGLLMSAQPEDLLVPANTNWRGTFGVGMQSSYRNPYFGIRRYPYSVDFNKNLLTFRYIENGVPLPTNVPVARDWSGDNNASVHRTGEVWATMLWECYVALLTSGRHSFDEAHDRMAQYLVEGLKMTPLAPTFVEARDGVLAAAYANDQADFETMFRAFARRGIGAGAIAPPRTNPNNSPVTESFDAGNAIELVDVAFDDEALFCDRDGVVDAGEIGRLRVWLKNVGVAPLAATTVDIISTDSRVSFPSGRRIVVPTFAPFETIETELEIALNGSTDIHEVVLGVAPTDPTLVTTATVTNVSFRVNTDEVANSTTTDDVEARNPVWTSTADASLATQQTCERVQITTSNHRWYCPDVGTPADLYLTSAPMVVSSTGTLVLSFDHRYDIEDGWDGAVVELTEDGGSSWVDVGLLAQPPYDGTLRSDTPNPLESREAWTGNNPSYPGLDRVTIDVGGAYAGQTVQVRFRAGSDAASAGAGWEFDDITIEGVDTPPFPALVVDDGVCVNRPPVADAGEDFVVDEGRAARLDSSGTTDLDGDQLVLVWGQLSGPTVTLDANGAFVAPYVEADTPLVFQLTALDASLASTDIVEVTILNSNRPVDVDAGEPQSVEPSEVVTLNGTAADPDGGPITLEWRQVGGPSVTLSATDVLTPTFSAPETDDGVRLVFELSATEREFVTTDTTTVTVGLPNAVPTVRIVAPAEVSANDTVEVIANVADPDGDAVTVQWRQLQGPAVTFVDAVALTTSFTAPDSEGSVEFEVVASDGELEARATHTVRIVVLDPKTSPDDEGGCSCSVAERGTNTLVWTLLLLVPFIVRRRR